MNFSIKNACLALGLCASTVVSANPTSWYSALFTKAHAGVTATRDNLTDPTPRYTTGDLFKVGAGFAVLTTALTGLVWWRYSMTKMTKLKQENDSLQTMSHTVSGNLKELDNTTGQLVYLYNDGNCGTAVLYGALKKYIQHINNCALAMTNGNQEKAAALLNRDQLRSDNDLKKS